jgi:hypothetical protein
MSKAKRVEFSVLDRYLLYFKKVYLGTESEEGVDVGEPDSEGFEGTKRMPSVMKILNFSHNLDRFCAHPTSITQKEADTFISVLDHLGRIYFRLPRLFYRFPQPESDGTEE